MVTNIDSFEVQRVLSRSTGMSSTLFNCTNPMTRKNKRKSTPPNVFNKIKAHLHNLQPESSCMLASCYFILRLHGKIKADALFIAQRLRGVNKNAWQRLSHSRHYKKLYRDATKLNHVYPISKKALLNERAFYFRGAYLACRGIRRFLTIE